MAKDKTAEVEQTDGEPTLAQAMAMFAEILKQNQAIQAGALDVQKAQLKQTARKSNARPHGISRFNPRGEKDYPMPELKCVVHMPWPLRPGLHGCTREEVELLNRIEPGEYKIDLLDGTSDLPITVIGAKNAATGDVDSLAFMGARDESGQYATLFTNERKQVMPPMAVFLRQMLEQKGIDTSDILPMKDEYKFVADTLAGKIHEGDPHYMPVSVGE